jgi:hypothetical protein
MEPHGWISELHDLDVYSLQTLREGPSIHFNVNQIVSSFDLHYRYPHSPTALTRLSPRTRFISNFLPWDEPALERHMKAQPKPLTDSAARAKTAHSSTGRAPHQNIFDRFLRETTAVHAAVSTQGSP